MAFVVAREGETIDTLLRRFKKAVEKEKLMAEMRDRAAYRSPGEKRREKRAKVVKYQRKQQFKRDIFSDIDRVKERAQGGESTTQRPRTTRYERAA